MIIDRIWTYWHDLNDIPQYILLCIDIMKKISNVPVVVITDNDLLSFLPTIRKEFYLIKNKKHLDDNYNHIPHRVDYIRNQLLYHYGGMWLDADTLVMPNFNDIFNVLKRAEDFAGRINEVDMIGINFMASIPKGIVISEYIHQQDMILDRTTEIESGSSFASRLLTPIVLNHSETSCLFIDQVSPIMFKNFHLFFEPGEPVSEYIKDDTYCCMLYNRVFPDEFKKMRREEILNSDFLISKLFKYALSQ